jgi:hypothetical protein
VPIFRRLVVVTSFSTPANASVFAAAIVMTIHYSLEVPVPQVHVCPHVGELRRIFSEEWAFVDLYVDTFDK